MVTLKNGRRNREEPKSMKSSKKGRKMDGCCVSSAHRPGEISTELQNQEQEGDNLSRVEREWDRESRRNRRPQIL
jgi:hypothetical protein